MVVAQCFIISINPSSKKLGRQDFLTLDTDILTLQYMRCGVFRIVGFMKRSRHLANLVFQVGRLLVIQMTFSMK